MEKRENDLLKLRLTTEAIDKELTMILQSLQWDRNDMIKGTTVAICKYNLSHRIPSDNREDHEKSCFYKQQGYNSKDTMLPDPLDFNANTLVKLNNEDIAQIIENSSKLEPTFRKVSVICMAMNSSVGSSGPEPSSLARLQVTYSADERRAIHDAVVSAVPSCHDLADLALFSSNGEEVKSGKSKSRVEILAELRDMRRRRAKYRVAAKTRNYSDVLRDVIRTQMEFYADVPSDVSIATTKDNREINKQTDNSKHNEPSNAKQTYKTDYHKHDSKYRDSRDVFKDRGSRRRSDHRNEDSNGRDRYVERSRDKKYDNRDEFSQRKDDNYGGSSQYKDEGGSRADRDGYKNRSRDRRYDNRAGFIEIEDKESYMRYSNHNDESRNITDRVTERSKQRNESRESLTREGGRKYDKYKSRDSKRRFEESSSSSCAENKSEGHQSQGGHGYRRYYDGLEGIYHDKRRKANK